LKCRNKIGAKEGFIVLGRRQMPRDTAAMVIKSAFKGKNAKSHKGGGERKGAYKELTAQRRWSKKKECESDNTRNHYRSGGRGQKGVGS